MALLYWSNPLLNRLKYAAALPFGGNWIPIAAFLPKVLAVTPSAGTSAGGDFITILGSGFDDGATVQIGGVSATGVVILDSTVITCLSGAHAVGAVNVVVTNSDTNTSTLVSGFTYLVPQWWEYNPAPGLGIPSGIGAWWAFGGPPLPFRFIASKSPLQSAISSPPLAPTAPILALGRVSLPTVDPVSWTPQGIANPTDIKGWYFSQTGFTTPSLLALAPGALMHPRAWDKIVSFATGNSNMLGGLPSVNYLNGLIYAGDDYTVGVTPPTVHEFDGGSDRLLLTIPNTAAGFFPTPAAPILLGYVLSSDGATDYKYAITAIDVNGKHTIGSPVLDAPAGHATLSATDQVMISWAAVSGAVSYNIYRTVSAGTPSTTGLIGTTGALTFSDAGGAGDGATLPITNTTILATPVPVNAGPFGTPGATDYKYVVVAVDGIGTTAGSTPADVPNGPTVLSGNNYNQINWPTVVGALNYNVYRTVGGTTQGFVGAVAQPNTISGSVFFIDTGQVGNGTTAPVSNTTGMATPAVPVLTGYFNSAGTGATDYKYATVALNAMGHSIGSPVVDAAAGPVTLSATNFIQLSVSSVSGALSYDVYRTVGGATQGKIANILATNPSLTLNDTGLVADGSTLPITSTAAASPIISTAITTMLLVGSDLYIATLDSGAVNSYSGRVFTYNLISQLFAPMGLPFAAGEVPYALAWFQGKLWCGTNASNGSNGNLYWFRAFIDTVWTKDTNSLATPVAPTISGYVTASGGSTDYKYALIAIDALGNHSAGSAALDAPAGAAVLSAGAAVIINFSSEVGAVSYSIYRTSSSGTPASTGFIASVLASGPLTLSDTGLVGDGTVMPATSNSGLTTPVLVFNNYYDPGSLSSMNTDYKYVVSALNALGHSIGSAVVDWPNGNTTLNGSFGNNLAWAAIPGATSYNVYRTASSGTPSSTGLISNVPASAVIGSTFLFTDLGFAGDSSSPPVTNTSGVATPATPTLGGYFANPGTGATDYKYAVVAVNALGHSAGSPLANAPNGPAALTSTAYIILAFTADPGATSYNVYRTTGGASQGLIATILSTAPLVLNDTGLAGDSSSLPVSNTTSVNGVDSLQSFGGQLYIGCDNVAGAFATLKVRGGIAGQFTLVTTGTAATARTNNGWTAMKIFNGVLYAAYWNQDTTPIMYIVSITTAGTVTVVYTGATDTLTPTIGMFVANGLLYALGGGHFQASLISTPDGIHWTDHSTSLNTIASETALPIFGVIGV